MTRKIFLIAPVVLLLIAGALMALRPGDTSRIWGVSVVAPPREVDASWTTPVKNIHAGWVAVMPYGFSYNGKPEVYYNSDRQWWGERKEGTRQQIRHAKQAGIKVMLKPMVWIPGSWPGGFEMADEANWKTWEASYEKYILDLAQVAKEEGADMFCIGTEFKAAAVKRPAFWSQLAAKVRKVFSGKLTYAANWDEYKHITFWKDLDYIGVDAYFPLLDEVSPKPDALKKAWDAKLGDIATLYAQTGKKILFTEFGYRSVNKPAWNQWELDNIDFDEQVNLQAQYNAYQAVFESVDSKPWFGGGFLWQWYTNHSSAGGKDNSDYTPQNKPAEALIRSWFMK